MSKTSTRLCSSCPAEATLETTLGTLLLMHRDDRFCVRVKHKDGQEYELMGDLRFSSGWKLPTLDKPYFEKAMGNKADFRKAVLQAVTALCQKASISWTKRWVHLRPTCPTFIDDIVPAGFRSRCVG